MIILIGDILKSKAQTLINTVNCVGIMGKGIALEFKTKFPDMYKDYIERCKRDEVKLGFPYIYKTLFPPQIINFPTKEHWKSLSKINDIEDGLKYLLKYYKEWGVTSLAIPPLGCGNGQLEWKIVGPLIYSYVKQMDIPVEMYAPYGVSPKELTEHFLSEQIDIHPTPSIKIVQTALNPAWVALVEIIQRIETQPYHWPIGRTIFQKIAYVATSEGLPTGLQYQRSSFGPFAKELKSVEAKLINSSLLQEERHGRMFKVKVGPNYNRIRKSFEPTFKQWADIIDKTADLFMRINTDQAEIIATILFSAYELKQKQQEIPSENEVFETVMEWKQKRHPQLNPTEVASTIRHLGVLRWLRVRLDKNLPLPAEEEFISA